MGTIAQQFNWLEGKPRMTVKEIAKHEKINHGTMKCWFSDEQYDVARVRARLETYRRTGGNGKLKLYPYKDGKEHTIQEIHAMEPHLSIPLIQQRYRQKDEGDWDAIFAPPGKAGSFDSGRRIDRRHFANLGPRRSPESIKPPTDYERRLWTGDAY